MDRWNAADPARLATLAVKDGEGEIDAFSSPSRCSASAGAPLERIGFQLVEAAEHPGVDVQRRAADAGNTGSSTAAALLCSPVPHQQGHDLRLEY